LNCIWKVRIKQITRNKEINKWKWIWTGIDIGTEEMKMLSEALKSSTSLTEIFLKGDELYEKVKSEMKGEWKDNYIGLEEARMIGEGLKDNSTLITLNLSSDKEAKEVDLLINGTVNRQWNWSWRNKIDKWRIKR